LGLLSPSPSPPLRPDTPTSPPSSPARSSRPRSRSPRSAPTPRAASPRCPPSPRSPTWKTFADRTRRDVLDKIVFRGDTARAWRDAKTRVEWLDTIPGGPGYTIRKLRYEALPGLWIPALLYVPDNVSGKIPVHLAVNGHDKDGKAAPYKQLRCINLAKRGIASLNVEWFAQGQLRTDGFAPLPHEPARPLRRQRPRAVLPRDVARPRRPPRAALRRSHPRRRQRPLRRRLADDHHQRPRPRVTLANPVAGYSSFRTRAEFPSDLGDSEQTPNDLATVADYTHLTALLAGRAALLTFNAKDNCCFASDHALSPLLAAAEPVFQLYGQPHRLRSHINFDPGTHNFELDNRQAFYRMVGDTFFPGDPRYRAEEIDSAAELKTAADLFVPLPADNLDFNQLARAASASLPRAGTATRETLASVVHYQPHTVTAPPPTTETRGDTTAAFYTLRVGATWTVPVVALTRGTPRGTTLLVADAGRKSLAARTESLLAAGQRVLAVDPFYFGESKISQRDFLYALLVAATGDRPLGIQTSQLAAIARWTVTEFPSSPLTLESHGPRLGLAALLATALEPTAITTLHQTDALPSLHEVIRQNWSVDKYPELFCFGLLAHFDIPQLRASSEPRD
jgi:hypothetical protein